MSIRVGINGYGRIGRNILRALYEAGRQDEISIVAINDIGDLEVSAHLTRYDSAHGPFNLNVQADGDAMMVGDDRIRFTACRNPADIPWKESEVDVVIESTGLFASREKSQGHLEAGAPRVLISAPAGKDVDATVVYGVNHDQLGPDHVVVSNASCTTNCLAPLAKVLMESVGIESGIMTTIHSYTNDQVLTDVAHSDLRRGPFGHAVDDSDRDRRGAGGRLGAAGTRRPSGRIRHPRADHQRFGGGLEFRGQPGDERGGSQRGRARGSRGTAERRFGVQRGSLGFDRLQPQSGVVLA